MSAEKKPTPEVYMTLKELGMELSPAAAEALAAWKATLRTDQTFEREYLGMPMLPTNRELRLEELAQTYHDRCDAFDKAAEAVPCVGERYRRCSDNAYRVLYEIRDTANSEGFHTSEVLAAIHDTKERRRHRTQ